MGLLLGASFALSASAEPKAEADKSKAAKPESAAHPAAAAHKAGVPGAAAPAADIKAKAGAQPTPAAAAASAKDKDKENKGKADKADMKADKADMKADKAELKADKAELKADKKADRAELKADKADNADKDSNEHGEHGDKHPGAKHGKQGHFMSAMAKLRERYKDGSLKKDELKKELEALRADRKERREQHRAALKERWGNSLAASAVLAELKHHERRMAHLNRMLLLAETERKGKAKDKLVERIEKLKSHENERHERKMSQLQSTSARGEKALNVPASATTAVAAPATEKAAVQTGDQK